MHPRHYEHIPHTPTATKVKPLLLLWVEFGLNDVVVKLTGLGVGADFFVVGDYSGVDRFGEGDFVNLLREEGVVELGGGDAFVVGSGGEGRLGGF
jgi:hypothetical protein